MCIDKRIYYAVKGFVMKDNKFLVMHKTDIKEDWWELPGGRMEFGETAEETIVREMKEETGLNIRPIKVIDTWNSIHDEYQITGIIYLCEIESGEVKLSSEHDKYQWIYTDINSLNEVHKVFRDRMVNWNWAAINKI